LSIIHLIVVNCIVGVFLSKHKNKLNYEIEQIVITIQMFNY